ncbi:hypothetical protein QKU48_gp0141 [Fadolivirus algeromassiliense]|jgi:hypothetical protein|uniref:Uncharacterized protein n=1 Tax=Fadolivirus FV1/VV64 TaxID=3070911 RepID=A0A7D3QVK1_9VIRU|nr:hypothetical protein QKU48_gp0141 [Fadolivirus algeromassiliense]QKF93599.1 hypothetical protein Fadolivirus_1_141 [Fadolivirus FV1/VV64]
MDMNKLDALLQGIDSYEAAEMIKFMMFFYSVYMAQNKPLSQLKDNELMLMFISSLILHYYTEKYNIITINDVKNLIVSYQQNGLLSIESKQQSIYDEINDIIKISI